MEQEQRYHRALDTALQLLAFVRDRPDAPEHVIVSHFVFTILSALVFEIECELPKRCPPEPSLN